MVVVVDKAVAVMEEPEVQEHQDLAETASASFHILLMCNQTYAI